MIPLLRVSSPRARAFALLGGATLLSLLACARAPVAPSSPPSPPPAADLRFEVGAVDPRVDPCADFYDYACGGWRATHPIPPDRAKWSRYGELEEANLLRERSIVEDAARATAGASPAEQRVGAYYAACMDQDAIDARGLAPLRDRLARIDAIRSPGDVLDVVADLHAHGMQALFDAYADADLHDPKKQILTLDTGALGLPTPDDYTRTDAKAAALRARYGEHLARLFRLAGLSEGDARDAAARAVAFETALAQRALTAAESRHAEAWDHAMTTDALRQRFPGIDWPAYFAKRGIPAVDRVNVAQPAWLDAVASALSAPDLGPLRDELRARLVSAAAPMLPRPIADEELDFDQRVVRGVKTPPARWRRCLALVDRDVGDDVGRIFLARYLPSAARERMKAMIDALLAAYRDDIQRSDWLGPEARAAALAKLDKSLIVIGESNHPRSFDGLRVTRDDAFGNAFRARERELARRLATLGAPTDREAFFDALPQELDAFGQKTMNATGFTAGFLQPPVFDPKMDDAVNFGGLGSVIGHELTHHFDDEGRRFDDEGALHPWWSPADVARFEERAQCFADEYSRFRTSDGTPLDGKLTLGENLADNGGIRLSYAALRLSEAGPEIDGFTPAQRFFLAWGQIRCENVTPEAERRQALTNEHSAGRWRVDGVVSNMPEFARAFSCPAGAAMAPANRCKLW